MTAVAGIFLVAHGLVHVAVWLSPPQPDAPFDACRSWLLGQIRPLARALAAGACGLFILAGVLALVGAGSAAGTAVAAAGVSLVLTVLTFNPWLSAAVAINVAIAVVAIA